MLYSPSSMYSDRKILYDYLYTMFPRNMKNDERCFFFSPDDRIEKLAPSTHVVFVSDLASVWNNNRPQQHEWVVCPYEEENSCESSPYRQTEEYIASRFKQYHIIRLGKLFGTMMHSKPPSDMGAYYLDDLYSDLQSILKADMPVINLAYNCPTRYSWLLPHLADPNYTQKCLQKDVKIKEFLKNPNLVIADSFFYASEMDQAIKYLSYITNQLPNAMKLEMCSISKYFDYKHHANWNVYDIKSLKTFFDDKKLNVYAVSNAMCDLDVNIHRSVEPFLQHFTRIATYAHVLDVQFLLLTEGEVRNITDIGAYPDISDAYAAAHVNFMKAITVCLNTLSRIDNEISLLIHPTTNSNYLFTNEQVVAMIEVLSRPRALGMSSELEKVDTASPDLVKMIYITKTNTSQLQLQSASSQPICIKVERFHYHDLYCSITSLLELILSSFILRKDNILGGSFPGINQ